jgi:hypothetical protein
MASRSDDVAVAIKEAGTLLDDRWVKLDAVGAHIQPGIKFADFQKKFYEFQLIDKIYKSHLTWWIGDMILAGERYFPDIYEQAIHVTGKSLDYIQYCRFLCLRIPYAERRTDISPSHHAVVARMEKKERDSWLEIALDRGWSVHEFRRRVRGQKEIDAPDDESLHQREPDYDKHLRRLGHLPKHAGVDMAEALKLEVFGAWWDAWGGKPLAEGAKQRARKVAREAFDAGVYYQRKGVLDVKDEEAEKAPEA